MGARLWICAVFCEEKPLLCGWVLPVCFMVHTIASVKLLLVLSSAAYMQYYLTFLKAPTVCSEWTTTVHPCSTCMTTLYHNVVEAHLSSVCLVFSRFLGGGSESIFQETNHSVHTVHPWHQWEVREGMCPLRIKAVFKPQRTMRNLLVHVKEKTPLENQREVIYEWPCKDCDLKYIGET